MKKKLSLLALLFTLSLTMPALAVTEDVDRTPPGPAYAACLYGTVSNKTEEQMLVTAHSSDENIVLHLSEQTRWIDAVSGLPLAEKPKDGDAVAAYYGPAVTLSLPPQSAAVAVIANIPQDMAFPVYAKVEAVEIQEDASVIRINGGTEQVTLAKDIPFVSHRNGEAKTLEDITVGTELVLWYPANSGTERAKHNAVRAVLLDEATTPVEQVDHITVLTKTGSLVINDKTLTLDSPACYEVDGTIFLPLRAIVEELGYEVSWDNAASTFLLRHGAMSASGSIGQIQYSLNKSLVHLEQAPALYEGKTYVPSDFFVRVLGAELLIDPIVEN